MSLNVAEIRELAKRFSPEEIESCIGQQLETGKNVCIINQNTEIIVNELAKAAFIKDLVEKGFSLADALRELAGRIRRIREGSEGDEK